MESYYHFSSLTAFVQDIREDHLSFHYLFKRFCMASWSAVSDTLTLDKSVKPGESATQGLSLAQD